MQAAGIANQQQPQQPPQPQGNQAQQPPQGVAAQQQQQAQQPAPQGQQQGQQPQQGAQQGAAANMAAQNQPNFVFALSPALINPGPIDYSTTKGIKLWRGAVKPLAKELFTLEPHQFKLFLSTLTERTMVYGWENIINIPVNVAVQGGPTHSLLTHYGQVTLQQVRDHAATYVNAQTRAAQNNVLLYTCLAASISPETKAKAMIFHSDYHEGQTPIGAAYLKTPHPGGKCRHQVNSHAHSSQTQCT